MLNAKVLLRLNGGVNAVKQLGKCSFHNTSFAMKGRHGGGKSAEPALRPFSKKQIKRRKEKIELENKKKDPVKEKIEKNVMMKKIDNLDVNKFVTKTESQLEGLSDMLMLPSSQTTEFGHEEEKFLVDADYEYNNLKSAISSGYSYLLTSGSTVEVTQSSELQTDVFVDPISADMALTRLAVENSANTLEMYNMMNSCGLIPSIYSMAAMMKYYNKNNDPQKSIQLFEEIIKEGSDPDIPCWEGLIEAKAKLGQYNEAMGIINQLKKSDIDPTIHMYTPLMQHLLDVKKYDELEDLWVETHFETCPFNVESFHIMFKKYIKTSEYERALYVYDEMKALKVPPTAETFALLFRASAEAPQFIHGYHDAIFDVMALMEQAEVIPTVDVYNNIIYAFGVGCDSVAAEFYYWEMIRKGIQPSEKTYTALFNAYARSNSCGKGKYEYPGRFSRLPDRVLTPEEHAMVDMGQKKYFSKISEGLYSDGRLDRGKRQFAPLVNQFDPRENEEGYNAMMDEILVEGKEGRRSKDKLLAALQQKMDRNRLKAIKEYKLLDSQESQSLALLSDGKGQRDTEDDIERTSQAVSRPEDLFGTSQFKEFLASVGMKPEDFDKNELMNDMSSEEFREIASLLNESNKKDSENREKIGSHDEFFESIGDKYREQTLEKDSEDMIRRMQEMALAQSGLSNSNSDDYRNDDEIEEDRSNGRRRKSSRRSLSRASRSTEREDETLSTDRNNAAEWNEMTMFQDSFSKEDLLEQLNMLETKFSVGRSTGEKSKSSQNKRKSTGMSAFDMEMDNDSENIEEIFSQTSESVNSEAVTDSSENNNSKNHSICSLTAEEERSPSIDFWKYVKIKEVFNDNNDPEGFLRDPHKSEAVQKVKQQMEAEKKWIYDEYLRSKIPEYENMYPRETDDDDNDDDDSNNNKYVQPPPFYDVVKQDVNAGHLAAIEEMYNTKEFCDPFIGHIRVESPITQVSAEYRSKKYAATYKGSLLNLLDGPSELGHSGGLRTMKQSEKTHRKLSNSYLSGLAVNQDNQVASFGDSNPKTKADGIWDKIEFGRAPDRIASLPREDLVKLNARRAKLAFSAMLADPNIKFNETVLNAYLKVFGEGLQEEQALKVFNSFPQFGLQVDARSYQPMIRMYLRMDNLEEALKLKQDMKSKNIIPIEDSFGFLMEVMIKKEKVLDAFKLFEESVDHKIVLKEKHLKHLRRVCRSLDISHPDLPEDPYQWVRDMKEERRLKKPHNSVIHQVKSMTFSK